MSRKICIGLFGQPVEREYLSAVGMAGDFQVKVVLSAKVGRRVRKQYPIPVVTAFGKGFFQIGIFAVEMTAESIGRVFLYWGVFRSFCR